jgi:hypothetical protein
MTSDKRRDGEHAFLCDKTPGPARRIGLRTNTPIE